MPWTGVTMSEQRQRFLEDYELKYYSISELADRFGISRTTAHKWINRYKEHGREGFHEHSRRPHSCPWQTDEAIVQELVKLRKVHPTWGLKLLKVMEERDPGRPLPSIPTGARILAREGLVRPRRRYRRAHPGCPKSIPQGPNDIWAADYKGQFRLKNGSYCFPLTVSDLASRYVLGCDAHPAIFSEASLFSNTENSACSPGEVSPRNDVPIISPLHTTTAPTYGSGLSSSDRDLLASRIASFMKLKSFSDIDL